MNIEIIEDIIRASLGYIDELNLEMIGEDQLSVSIDWFEAHYNLKRQALTNQQIANHIIKQYNMGE